MTRINLVKPSELTDQHLVAEYREIFMVPAALRRSLVSKSGVDTQTLPQDYLLGTGHVRFFYDKGLYLQKRYLALIEEMKKRGMSPDPGRVFPIRDFPKSLRGDYVPKRQDLQLIRKRLREKIALKPHWYRYYGENL